MTQGHLFIVSAPSGAGKSSLNKALIESDPALKMSVSFTTRQPRLGEVAGVDYNFITIEDFEARVHRGEFLEYAHVHGNYYGTNKFWIETELAAGHDIMLEIDWQGAKQVKAAFPSATGIFILPPSMEVLSKRLRGRGTDSEEVIRKRLDGAHLEISQAPHFDYIVINDDFQKALAELKTIIAASRLMFLAQKNRHPELFAGFGL